MKTATLQKLSPSWATLFQTDYGSNMTWPWLLKQFAGLAMLAFMGALSYVLVSHFIFQSVTVKGQSMYPSLFPDSNYWLIRGVYMENNPQRDDIVAVRDPQDGCLVVKRIIATPGECIYLSHGKVYVNGRLLKEPYLPNRTQTFAYDKNGSELFILGKDQFFVMGDNRGNSCDSRTFGPVSRRNILGMVID